MKNTLYSIISITIQLTWGSIQTFFGLLLYFVNKKSEIIWNNGSFIVLWDHKGGVSLGLFVFVDKNVDIKRRQYLIDHELGHTIQSLVLGPLYLFIIGLPSFIWANLPYYISMRKNSKVTYESFVVEKNATQLGILRRKFLGEKYIRNLTSMILEIILLIMIYLVVRYPLVSFHNMYDWSKLLFLIGIGSIITEYLLKLNYARKFVPSGYAVSFVYSVVFEANNFDLGKGPVNNQWLIWIIVYIVVMVFAIRIERINRRQAQGKLI